MIDKLKKIYSITDKKSKFHLFFIFILTILVGVLETMGIGLIFPIIALFLDNSSSSIFVQNFFQTNFDINNKNLILKIVVLVFCIIIIVKNIILLFSVWNKERFLLNLSSKLSTNLFTIYLDKPMSYHFSVNSSHLVRNLIGEIKTVVKSFILSFLNIFSELVFLFAILILLSFNNLKITLISFSILFIVSFAMTFLLKNNLKRFGETRVKYSSSILIVLKESFDSIKEIKINLLRDSVLRNYFKFFYRIGKMNILAAIIGNFPRALFEIAVALVLGYFLINGLNDKTNLSEYIPTIALYFAAIYRAIPSLNRIVNNIQAIRYSGPSFTKVEKDLFKFQTQKVAKSENIIFKNSLNFINVSFRYEDKKILENINFKINKNSLVSIFGESGSGKSTLLDLILGLLKKTGGEINIDQKKMDLYESFEAWSKNVSYVPQSIYIYDNTIEKNITLTENEKFIDHELLNKAIQVSKLQELISNSEKGLDTPLGESGEKISGGQRQRISIARAIYRNNPIIVLDEATNALDHDTEKEILINLSKLKRDKTIIFASHTTSILSELSDQVFMIKNGNIEIIQK